MFDNHKPNIKIDSLYSEIMAYIFILLFSRRNTSFKSSIPEISVGRIETYFQNYEYWQDLIFVNTLLV